MKAWFQGRNLYLSKSSLAPFLSCLCASLIAHFVVIFLWRDQVFMSDHKTLPLQLNVRVNESMALENVNLRESTQAPSSGALSGVTTTLLEKKIESTLDSDPRLMNTTAASLLTSSQADAIPTTIKSKVLNSVSNETLPTNELVSLDKNTQRAASIDKTLIGKDLMTRCPIHPAPTYSISARRMGEAGVVVLRFVVEASGRISAATVQQSSSSARLDASALQSLQNWRCTPRTSDGVEVSHSAVQKVSFSLEE